MTRGYQNTEADAHQQLGYAIDQGINRRHHHGTTQESFTFTTNEISLRRSELLKWSNITPIDMHSPLRFWSRNNFQFTFSQSPCDHLS